MSTSPDTTRSHVQHCAGTSQCGITRLIRAAVLALLLAAGCYLAYGVGKLSAEWRHVSQPLDVRQMATAEFAPQAMVLPLAGQWSFAELDWKLRSHTIDKNHVAERFDSLVASAADQNGD